MRGCLPWMWKSLVRMRFMQPSQWRPTAPILSTTVPGTGCIGVRYVQIHMLQINADAVKHPNTMYLCVFFFFEMKKEGSSREEEGRRQRKMVQGLYCTVVWKRHADACMALACREGVVYCSFAWWQKLKQGRQPFCCCCCVLQLSFFLFREEKGEQRLMQHTDALSLSLSPRCISR